MSGPGQARPGVSVVVPFHGSREKAERAAAALGALELRDGDELIVADNTEDAVFASLGTEGMDVIVTEVKRSAYAARNIGAEAAANDWLLFLDDDCRPPRDLIDRYFRRAPSDAAGAVAGEVQGAEGQSGVIPAYIRSRRHLDQELGLRHPYRPMAVTANLLVRREAWQAVGGFAEQTRSGADADFCWRLQDVGWALELDSGAAVEHVHRDSLRALLEQARRDGAGGRWLMRRWPGYRAHPPLAREIARGLSGGVLWALTARPRRALFKLIDPIFVAAAALGTLESNATPAVAAAPPRTVVFCDEFPAPGDALVGWLAHTGACAEAARRPRVQDWPTGRAVPARFAEDEGPLARARAVFALAARRPLALARVLRESGTGAALAAAPAAIRLVRTHAAPRATTDAGDAARIAASLAGLSGPVEPLALPQAVDVR